MLAQLVAQVRVRIAVADNFYGVVATDAAVIGREHHGAILCSQAAEEVAHSRVAQPALRDAPISRFVAGKLPNHEAFRTSVAKHVNKVDNHDIQVVLHQLRNLCDELLCGVGVVYLVVRERVLAAITFELRPDQRFFIEVLALLAVLIDPKLREHLGDVIGHESAEDGVASILRRCRKDAAIEVLLDCKGVANLVQQDAPLVVAEVVDDDKEDLLAFIQQRIDGTLKDVGAHHRPFLRFLHPMHVVLAYELGELGVCFVPLRREHLLHSALRLAQLKLPIRQLLIDFLPFFKARGIVYLHAQSREVLLIIALQVLRDDFLLLDVLLERQQNLCGIDWLDEVVGNLRADCLLHDVLLFTLRHHHHRRSRQQFLYAGQCLEAAQTRHVLVEQDEVERLFRTTVECIVTVRHGFHLITFLLEKKDVSLQELNLVVNPKQFICSHESIICCELVTSRRGSHLRPLPPLPYSSPLVHACPTRRDRVSQGLQAYLS